LASPEDIFLRIVNCALSFPVFFYFLFFCVLPPFLRLSVQAQFKIYILRGKRVRNWGIWSSRGLR
jgi:hypothetical protein